MHINTFTAQGVITNNYRSRAVGDASVCEFEMELPVPGDKTQVVRFNAWNDHAAIADKFKRGSRVRITGAVRESDWESSSEKKNRKVEVKIDAASHSIVQTNDEADVHEVILAGVLNAVGAPRVFTWDNGAKEAVELWVAVGVEKEVKDGDGVRTIRPGVGVKVIGLGAAKFCKKDSDGKVIRNEAGEASLTDEAIASLAKDAPVRVTGTLFNDKFEDKASSENRYDGYVSADKLELGEASGGESQSAEQDAA